MNKIYSSGKLSGLFGEQFEFIDDGEQNGQYNMDFDYERTTQCAEGKVLPMFRLYAWAPWALSLGYNQKEDQVDKDKCSELGFDIVRRPTGGRAVLHAREITYSVALPVPDSLSVHDIYRQVHTILLRGLQALGPSELGFEKAQPDFRNFYKSSEMSVSCFASSARHEIESNGRKVVGSAQRLFGKTLLQHGSIILGPGHEQLADIAKVNSPDATEKLRQFIQSKSISMAEVLGYDVDYDCAAKAIRQALLDSI